MLDGEPMSHLTGVQVTDMRFQTATNKKETSTGIFSVDDGTWASGDTTTRTEQNEGQGIEMDVMMVGPRGTQDLEGSAGQGRSESA